MFIMLKSIIIVFLVTVFASNSDDVACILNRERRAAKLPTMKVVELLEKTSLKQAKYMSKNKKLTTNNKSGNISKRLEKAGYNWDYANELVGQKYTNAKAFARAMIKLHKDEIMDREAVHLGVGKSGPYWALDLGNSKDSKLKTRRAKC